VRLEPAATADLAASSIIHDTTVAQAARQQSVLFGFRRWRSGIDEPLGCIMRIGTWNLDAKWTQAHQALLAREHCDVWLLTEVSPSACDPTAPLAGYHRQLSKGIMLRRQHYAAIFSLLPLGQALNAHDASAAAFIDGIAYCSTILPWARCGSQPGSLWVGESLEAMARPAIDQLMKVLPKANTVWGGDWNQALAGGSQRVCSDGLRNLVELSVSSLDLLVPTAGLPHQKGGGRYTIDHIAVPHQWNFRSAARIGAKGLSDHDAYIIEIDKV
jgi:hypothetical protein